MTTSEDAEVRIMPDVRGDVCDVLQTVVERIEEGRPQEAANIVQLLIAVLAGRPRGGTIQ